MINCFFFERKKREITGNNIGGYDYAFRLEAIAFEKFSSNGDYIGAAIKREFAPKLSIGLTCGLNNKAPGSRCQNGSFTYNLDGSYEGKTFKTIFAVSKYIVDHKLKIRTDIIYRQSVFDVNKSANRVKNDLLFLRLQLDVHF